MKQQGIYCYIDKKNNNIIYIGKDSNIYKNKRHKDHLKKCNYNQQQINRILQNTPNRYKYKIILRGKIKQKILNGLEMAFIQKYNPKFNYTKGGEGKIDFQTSNITKQKISQAKQGINNPCFGKKKEQHPAYGYHHSKQNKQRISKKNSINQNTTGFYRVSISKNNKYKQQFFWRYRYYRNKKRQTISSTNLKQLKEKVIKKELDWYIINKYNAKKTCKQYNYNINELK